MFERKSAPKNDRGSKAVSLGILLIWCCLWTGFIGAFDYWAAGRFVNQLRTSGFEPATGRVIDADVQSTRHKNSYTHRLELAYRYEVLGTAYEGQLWNYTEIESSDKWAQRIAQTYPPGTSLTVHYNPADPSEAVIEPGLTGVEPFVLLFMTPFHLIVIGSWGVVVNFLRSEDWRRYAPVSGDGDRVRVRLAQYSPKLTAAFALFLGSIGGALAVVLIAGSHPPLWLPLVVWGTLLFACNYVYQRMARPIRNGDVDLVLRLRAGTLTLPATQGRKAPLEIPLAQIVSIEPEIIIIARRRNDYETREYNTTVSWEEQGVLRRERLMQWMCEEQAVEFAAWLSAACQLHAPREMHLAAT